MRCHARGHARGQARNLGRGLGGTALLLAGVTAAQAQVSYPAGTGGGVPLVVPALPVTPGQPGVAPAGTAGNPLHVTGTAGGDASAANQQAQLAQESAAAAALGAASDPAATGNGSVTALLKRVRDLLSAPLTAQVTGSVGVTSMPSVNTVVTVGGAPISAANPAPVGGNVGSYGAVATGSFARPANTATYAAGQLIANSTAAGSVVPVALAACRMAGATGRVKRVRLTKTGAGSNTLANASFRVHLYRSSLFVVANGDGGAWSTSGALDYVGAADVTMDRAFSDGAKGIGAPLGGEAAYDCGAGGTSLYALVEARAAYAPASGETFSVTLELSLD